MGIGWGLWDAAHRVGLEFGRVRPDVTIEVHEERCTEDGTESLRSHAVDVSFGRPPHDGDVLEVLGLYQERLQVAISADHPLAARSCLSIRDLETETLLLWDRQVSPMLFDLITGLYTRAGIVPRTMATPGVGPFNLAGLMQVASGRGIYLCLGVPHTGSHPSAGVAERPLSDPDALIDVCLASRKGEPSPVVRQFVEAAANAFHTGDARVARFAAR